MPRPTESGLQSRAPRIIANTQAMHLPDVCSGSRSKSVATGEAQACILPLQSQAGSEQEGAGGQAQRRRRRDTGKQRPAGRPWSDQEECLFLQALEQHGRNWKVRLGMVPRQVSPGQTHTTDPRA